jgi:hypothetical protein
MNHTVEENAYVLDFFVWGYIDPKGYINPINNE